jgi:Ca2+-binding EF-hand superfamily protein
MSLSLEEGDAFFRAVDLDEDGKISYSELIEAVHLLEPLPYRVPSSVAIREAEL